MRPPSPPPGPRGWLPPPASRTAASRSSILSFSQRMKRKQQKEKELGEKPKFLS